MQEKKGKEEEEEREEVIVVVVVEEEEEEEEEEADERGKSFCVSEQGELKEPVERLVIIFPSQDRDNFPYLALLQYTNHSNCQLFTT